MYVLGIDVGTTCCKALLISLEGAVKGYAFEEYEVLFSGSGLAEQEPEKVWECVLRVVSKAIAKSGIKDVRAVSVSVQGDAVIPIDKNGNVLHNAILGMDLRSIEQAEKLKGIFGDRWLFNKTGMRAHPLNSLTKILWFKENAPHIYSNAYKFMTYADFILFKFGAEPVIDHSMASRTMAFDLHSKEWSIDILGKSDIDIGLFSKAVPSGTVVGTINRDLANSLGINPNMLLITGGHDQTCAAIGAGVIREEVALDSLGTAHVLSTTFYKPLLTDIMFNSYYPCYCHVENGMYFTFALNHTGGILLKWYKDNLAYAETAEAMNLGVDAYELIISKTKETPSPLMVLPHFNGSGTPNCDLESKGAIIGLSLASDRNDIVKAIMECLTFEMMINIETMRNAGISINDLRAVGGGAKSAVWLQLKADITNSIVSTLKIRDAACLGAAIIAAAASGGYTGIEQGVEEVVKIDKSFYPETNKNNIYETKFGIYKELYNALKYINKKL